MSGSPVYIDGKLLGAVAYRLALWQGADRRRHAVFADGTLRRLLRKTRPGREGQADADRPGQAAHRSAARTSTRSPSPTTSTMPQPTRRRRPVDDAAADAPGRQRSEPHSLAMLRDKLGSFGMVPMQGGAVAGNIAEEERNIAAGAGRGPDRVADHRRFRPVRHRHRDAHRRQARLRLGPSVLRARGVRIPAHDRLHPHHLSPAEHQLQDGLAAPGRRHHQRRRQHLHRRLARPPAADMLPVSHDRLP